MKTTCILFTLIMGFAGIVLASGEITLPTSSADPMIPSWATGGGVIAALVGGPVFTMWFSWYMTTVRIPAVEAAHSQQIKMKDELHASQQKQLIDNFRADLVQMWAVAREDNQRLSQAIDRLATLIESRLKA